MKKVFLLLKMRAFYGPWVVTHGQKHFANTYFTMEIPKRFQIVNKRISGEGKQDVQSGEE